MKRYRVTGMSCEACRVRVEKAVGSLPNVTSCAVNLLTGTMGVEGSASDEEIIAAVKHAGYDAGVQSRKKAETASRERSPEQVETAKLRRRLFWSLGFWLPLMYLSMGHMMWSLPLPAPLADHHVAMGACQLILTAAIALVNRRFFISGFRALWKRSPNMDTLVSLGATAAIGYSVYALVAMAIAMQQGDAAGVAHYMDELYFESAATILTLITVGKTLEARAKGKTTDALRALIRLTPRTATVIRDGKEMTIPADQIAKGDVFVVRPGENIPADGIVLQGHSAVNESALTGESLPVEKEPESPLYAGTINASGFLRCRATRVGEDTSLSKIIQMVSDAAATKAPIAKVADRVSGFFVPVVMAIAVVTVAVWLLLGREIGFALARGISVLVISCPCALGLATPVAIMVGNGVGAKNGILFKTAISLETAGKADTVVLDKTGTVTAGQPQVTDLLPAEGVTADELLLLAASLEQNSEHPLSRAIRTYAEEKSVMPEEVSAFQALPGFGLQAEQRGRRLTGGNSALIEKTAPLSETMKNRAKEWAAEGKTPLFFARDNLCLGLIAVSDVIKEDSPEAIRQLRDMGIRVILLTGDNHRTAEAVGKAAGVDEVIADVLPDGKEAVIRELQRTGRVAMVGDGINDAPALTRADVGMAIGAGTDVAIDSADVVLMHSRLSDVAAAIRISRATLRNIHENLFWAFLYNVIGIPIAAGCFVGVGLTLNPMLGAAAMSLSSFCVVVNALRLNLFRIHDTKSDKKRKPNRKENKTVTITLKIDGMMCSHCEAHVKKALEAIAGVTEATTDRTAGTAIVNATAGVSVDALKNAVTEAGYTVTGVN